jgi:glutamyl-tRNA synthetase
MDKHYVGRFAPSPSGRMHLGNLYAGLLAWLRAKSQGGQILLRIEDLDPLRCPKAFARQIIADLQWLGLPFDNEDAIVWQSDRSRIYQRYAEKLQAAGLTYPCFCSRAEIHAAAAPHASDGRAIYPGTCRHLTAAQLQQKLLERSPALRVMVPDALWSVTDQHYGECALNLARDWGDAIIRRSDGVWAYQLAMTVDDGLMGVTEIVRGQDLLSSAPLQKYLFTTLGFPVPDFFHLPLLINSQGERLAKRDLAADMSTVQAKFPRPQQVIGYLGYLAGQLDKPEALTAAELATVFDPAKLPVQDIVVPA